MYVGQPGPRGFRAQDEADLAELDGQNPMDWFVDDDGTEYDENADPNLPPMQDQIAAFGPDENDENAHAPVGLGAHQPLPALFRDPRHQENLNRAFQQIENRRTRRPLVDAFNEVAGDSDVQPPIGGGPLPAFAEEELEGLPPLGQSDEPEIRQPTPRQRYAIFYDEVSKENVPEDKQSDTCSICLNELFSDEENLKVIQVRCGHMFHPSCVQPWLQMENTCPMCREDLLEPIDEEQ